MKYGKQIKIARWLEESPVYVSRVLNGKKRPSAANAERLEGITGVSVRDWLLLPHEQLKAKVEIAYEVSVCQ